MNLRMSIVSTFKAPGPAKITSWVVYNVRESSTLAWYTVTWTLHSWSLQMRKITNNFWKHQWRQIWTKGDIQHLVMCWLSKIYSNLRRMFHRPKKSKRSLRATPTFRRRNKQSLQRWTFQFKVRRDRTDIQTVRIKTLQCAI